MRCVTSRYRCLTILFIASVITGLPGCDSGPKLVSVTGTVTHNGKPLPDLTLTFMPETGRPSMAKTDRNGKYELLYTFDRKGVVPGRYKAIVQTTPANSDDRSQVEAGRLSGDAKAINDKYGDRNATPLVFEIKQAQVLDLKLD